MSRDEIKTQWEKERDLGTELHAFIEAWYNGEKPDVDKQIHPEWDQFVEKFQREHGSSIFAFRTEWRIWSGQHDLAGTIDLVSKNPDGTYSLYDWKRTKHPIAKGASCFGKYGKGPLMGVPDTKYNAFRLELSLYKRILELHYDINVTKLFVVRFHPNMLSYQMVQVDDWPGYVDRLLCHRLDETTARQGEETGLEEAFGSLSLRTSRNLN